MNTKTRELILAGAFAAVVAAGATALTVNSAQTQETSLNQACAHVTWPMIPTQCLEGADSNRAFRTVTTRGPVEYDTMATRFALAFN